MTRAEISPFLNIGEKTPELANTPSSGRIHCGCALDCALAGTTAAKNSASMDMAF
jgi:hypothetical protein